MTKKAWNQLAIIQWFSDWVTQFGRYFVKLIIFCLSADYNKLLLVKCRFIHIVLHFFFIEIQFETLQEGNELYDKTESISMKQNFLIN